MAHFAPDPELTRQLSQYAKTVGVTLQWTVENRVIEFVRQAAGLDSTICYVLIPRNPKERDYLTLPVPQNVRVVIDKDFYRLMGHVDFHSTAYSTCALEAPSLGVRNVMINIDGESKRYYGHVLTDSRVTRYADTPEELVSIVNTFPGIDRETVRRLNGDIIAVGYRQNLRDFLVKNRLGPT